MIEIEVRGFLFDMDGVLVSSIGSVRRSWRAWCKLYGVAGWETFEIQHGQRAREIIRGLVPGIDVEEGLRVIEDMEVADMEDLRVLQGVAELLGSLPEDKWAIVTSATLRLVTERLKEVGLPVPSRLVHGDSVVNGKPAADPYLAGAALLGLPAAECLVVEDAPSGLRAGVAAGARTLGVLGTHTLEDLHEADWVVGSMADVAVRVDGERLVVAINAVR